MRRARRHCRAACPSGRRGDAFPHYTGIARFTKDFDIFVEEKVLNPMLDTLRARVARIDRPYLHWLAKAHRGDDFIDLIYSSGNGVARVDRAGSSTRNPGWSSTAR